MSEIKKFTTNNATITIDNATTLQFNTDKCYKIDAPYIFSTLYICKHYVLLHELQGYNTDKIIEPKTADEFAEGLLTMDNPFYVDYYHTLHDKISIDRDKDDYSLLPSDSYNGDIFPYKGEALKYFHLFEADENSWTEIDLDIGKLNSNGFVEWIYFANGMISEKKTKN